MPFENLDVKKYRDIIIANQFLLLFLKINIYSKDKGEYMANMLQDMTKGKEVPLLLKFTILLLIGNLFQQCYSIVDIERVYGKQL